VVQVKHIDKVQFIGDYVDFWRGTLKFDAFSLTEILFSIGPLFWGKLYGNAADKFLNTLNCEKNS
jgi:hypothetical protein